MSVESMMQDGRQLAATMLIDEGTITRPGTGPGTIDPGTGDWTPPTSTSVYSGPCRVRRPSTAQEQELVFGDVNTTVSRYTVDLPHDAPLVAVDDVFMLIATNDPEVLNVAMRVVTVVGKSVLMYRQLGLEAVE